MKIESAARIITSHEPEPICISAPRMMIDEIALVTAINGVCRRMRHAPDHLEADEDAEDEDDEMLHETGRSVEARQQDQPATDGQQAELIAGLGLERRDFLGPLLFRCQLHRFCLRRRLGNRRDLWRWWREGYLAPVGHGRPPDHIVVHVVVDLAVILGRQIIHHMTDVGSI